MLLYDNGVQAIGYSGGDVEMVVVTTEDSKSDDLLKSLPRKGMQLSLVD